MGIPYYFYLLTKKYDNIITNNFNNKCDTYCIDFNGIIHPVANNIINNLDNFDDIEDIIISKLWDKILQYINIYSPDELIICVDGVAPIAKMIQQRKRRYLSIYRNKIDNIDIKWDTNAITPGTNFMNKLNTLIKKNIRYNTLPTNIIYSGSDENGEGEHKIFHKIKNISNNIVINGLDADLIILSLISHKKNIILMRENKEDDITFLNIDNLRIAIIKELIIKWNLDNTLYNDYYSNYSKDLIESYCVMCSFIGNDFIPCILTIDIKNDGFDKLINFTKNSIINHGLLVINNNINYKCLSNIFIEISKNEDKDLLEKTEKYIKKTIYNNNINSEYYAIKNKDNLSSIIYNDISKWRLNYYKFIFDYNINIDSSIINSSCYNYIKGFYWTFNYYKQKDIDHYWYYPYSYPPSSKDISNYIISNSNEPIIKSKGDFINSNMQLLIVLPKSSNHLLKDKYKSYTTDLSKGLYHMYPDNYNIHTFLKIHLWECSPILPIINLKYIKNIIEND